MADFLDLNYVIRNAAGDWFGAPRESSGGLGSAARRGASAFSRGLLRGSLDMAGYQVFEAASVDETIRCLEQQTVDLVVAALDLPAGGTSALRTAMSRRAEWNRIPVLSPG